MKSCMVMFSVSALAQPLLDMNKIIAFIRGVVMLMLASMMSLSGRSLNVMGVGSFMFLCDWVGSFGISNP